MPDDAGSTDQIRPHGSDRGSIRHIAWGEMFPWLSISRAFRLATDPRQLVLAALGVLLTAAGWWLLAFVFSGSDEPRTQHVVQSYQAWPWQPPARPEFVVESSIRPIPHPGVGKIEIEAAHVVGDGPRFAPPSPPPFPPGPLLRPEWPRANPIIGTWFILSRPFLQLFDRGFSVTAFTVALLCGLWSAAVWALFGGAITRLAAVRLAREERVPIGQALRHARQRWAGYFGAPLFPLIGVLLPTLGLAAVGWLLRFDFGLVVLGVLFPLLLVGGVLVVILLLGLLFGWPLMWATISTEGTDTFDALSRTYAYVYQRPLSYLFYVVIATLLGWLAAIFAWGVGAAVVYLTVWGISWSAGVQRTEQVVAEIAPRVSIAWPVAVPLPPIPQAAEQPPFAEGSMREAAEANVPPPPPPLTATGRFGARLIAIWIGFVELLVIAFNVSFFWSSAAAIYFLLRQQVDATETDEVYIEDEEERFGLPPLEADSAGVPQAADVEEDTPGETRQ